MQPLKVGDILVNTRPEFSGMRYRVINIHDGLMDVEYIFQGKKSSNGKDITIDAVYPKIWRQSTKLERALL